MGFFQKIADFFTSTRRPASDTPLLSTEELKKKILDLNKDSRPYQIRPANSDEEGVDFVAEWKIVDAKWYQIFAKAALKDTFKIFLKLHSETSEVHALDQRFTVAWSAGIPVLSMSVSAFRGQQQSVEFGTNYAFTEKGELGQVYNYHFSTNEMKKPIQDAVTGGGWIYRGVVRKGKL
ncbi:MAG: hypothetical protein UR28_C0010G0044 [Candidatus Peregrinibacteria bacterium GW2011_GWF2_33_10]|nr:MAG: hypothetical protein UR28_C0010G0044 [Candidatus Peregrinibacteria bacterium GW2011_GWF2_33_10]